MYSAFAFDSQRCRMTYTTFNALQMAIDFCRQCAGFSCVLLSGTSVEVWNSRGGRAGLPQ